VKNIIGKYPYIIAEIGANHNGDMDLAKKLVEKAKEAGCDSVKFQLWNESTAHTSDYINELMGKDVLDVDKVSLSTPELGLNNIKDQMSKYKFYKDEHIEIKEFCDEMEIDFASTGMNVPDMYFLKELGVKYFKVASQDTDNPFFLGKIAQMDVPTIVSTGLSIR
jgi:sialic acid synthase SpsE